MRTQNPPPLNACRFDSDLGTIEIIGLSALAVVELLRNRRIGLSMCAHRIFPAKAVTHSLHVKSAGADRIKVVASSASRAPERIESESQRPWQIVLGACNQRGNTKAPWRRPENFPSEILQKDRQWRSAH